MSGLWLTWHGNGYIVGMTTQLHVGSVLASLGTVIEVTSVSNDGQTCRVRYLKPDVTPEINEDYPVAALLEVWTVREDKR